MKRMLIWLGVLSVIAGVSAMAQDPVDTWQGTLHVGRDIRLVLQVSKSDAGLKGKLFSIDQGAGGMGLGTSTMSVDGGMLKFSIVGMDASYEGKVALDGKSASGAWKQGGHDTPLVLEHVNADAAWEIPKATKALSPMDPKLAVSYEVATIKPTNPAEQRKGFNLRGGHIVVTNTTVQELITLAYNIHPKQLVGGPAWLTDDHYDMDILPDHEGLPSFEQARGVARKILADRFAMKSHEEMKELSAYVLSVTKNGPKMEKSTADPNSPPGMGGPPGRCMMRNGSMAEFAQVMQMTLDRPVSDQTGLKDRYDFTLKWTPDETQYGGKLPTQSGADNGANADPLPPLFVAIQEQIGLKLEPKNAPVKMLVIDGIEKPSAN